MWVYKNNNITDINDFGDPTPFGFVYITTHIPTGVSYIGKKVLFNNIKKKLTKKELNEQSGPGRKSNFKKIIKESDWKTYYGSETSIKASIKEGRQHEFKREILQLVYDKKLLTYFECKYMFIHEVLEKPTKYLNSNILGKFFTIDFMVRK
jgi:hypothetical protein